MPGRGPPVCLTRSPPFDIQSNQLVFYDVVDVSTTAKSGVLSTIADAGGEARLPDAVTLSDFKLWISFVNGNYTNFKNLSFLDLCTIVKVADALDDKDIAQWSNLAAKRLVFHAASDPSGISPDSIDVALSTLADDVQHRIFSVAASAPRKLYRLLSFLPPHYHTSVVAATVTAERVLSLPFSLDSIPALKVLTVLPQSHSSILSLHSHGTKRKAGPLNKRVCSHIASHLVQALQHHMHLTEVRVSTGNISNASAELLIPAIAGLKSLQALHLGDEDCPFPAVSVPLLQQALSSLPRLNDLSVMLSAFPGTAKRPRESEAAPDAPCLAAALSPATTLTSLHISIVKASQRIWYSANTPLELPHLRQLSVNVGIKHWALTTDFMNHLRADHLTSLRLHLPDKISVLDQLPDSSVAGARRFVDRLAHFSQLRNLSIALPSDAQPKVGFADAAVMEMMRASATAVLASLTQLQNLSISAECPVLCSTVPVLATSLTAVTFLSLHSVSGWRAAYIHVPWSDMCTSLCQMNLKSLSVTARQRGTSTGGLAALRRLTQLSALDVDGWVCLKTTADCEALAGMTSVRRLSLVRCFEGCEPAAAVRALLALSALTELRAGHPCEWSADLNIEPFVELCNHDARAAWPALRVLCLDAHLSHFSSLRMKVVRWSIGLPALKKLTVDLPPKWIGDEEDSEADECSSEEHVESNGEEMIYDLDRFYRRIAAEAGVELVRL